MSIIGAGCGLLSWTMSISRGTRLALTGLVTVITAFLFLPATAQASTGAHVPQRGALPLIWNSGQEAFISGPLPEPFAGDPELAGWQAGYYCDVTGIFWSDFSVRNCKPAAIKGNEVIDAEGSPELAAAVKQAYPDMKRGIWNHFGWMILLFVVLALVGLKIKSSLGGSRNEPDPVAETGAAPQSPDTLGAPGAPGASGTEGGPAQPGYPHS
jgi:hypothetical protein